MAQSSDTAIKIASSVSIKIGWLCDLLPQFLSSTYIASYSYKLDWRQDVKTNLQKYK